MDRLHQDQYAHDARDLGTRVDACPRVPPRGGLAMVCGRRVRLARNASHTMTAAPAVTAMKAQKGGRSSAMKAMKAKRLGCSTGAEGHGRGEKGGRILKAMKATKAALPGKITRQQSQPAFQTVEAATTTNISNSGAAYINVYISNSGANNRSSNHNQQP